MLKQYAISIITAGILSVMLEMLLPPKNYRKYISVVIGLVVMMVIISPLKNLFGNFEGFVAEIPKNSTQAEEKTPNSLVSGEFKKRLGEKIEEEILKNLATETECTVVLELSEKNEILGIKEVKINPLTAEIAVFINEKFAIEKEKIRGQEIGN